MACTTRCRSGAPARSQAVRCASIARCAALRCVASAAGPPTGARVGIEPAASWLRDQDRECLFTVGSGSSTFALERPLRRINLTCRWKCLWLVTSRCRRRHPAGQLGGGPWSDSVAGSNGKWSRFGSESLALLVRNTHVGRHREHQPGWSGSGDMSTLTPIANFRPKPGMKGRPAGHAFPFSDLW